MVSKLNIRDDEADKQIALKIVETYLREAARVGLKRTLEIDDIINAYLYVYSRLIKDRKTIPEIEKTLDDETRELIARAKRNEIFPELPPD